MRRAEVAAVAEGEAAGASQAVGILGLLAMTRRDDETILVVGDGEIPMHLFDLRDRETGLRQQLPSIAITKLPLPVVDSHGEHALERQDDRSLRAGRQQVGQVTYGDAERAHVRNRTDGIDCAGVRVRLDRRQRRHVPNHRQGPIFRVEGERDAPVDRHLVGRRAPCGLDPGIRNAVGARLRCNLRIVGIEKERELCFVKVLRILNARRALDLVGVVEQHAEIADAADAGLRAHRRLARLDARIAEDAFLGFAGLPVVIDLLVGAARDAHPPAAALLLVDEYNAVLLALIDRARGAGGDAGRVEAVLAQPRQIHHEGLLELAVDLLLDVAEIVVGRALRELAAQDLLPVGTPLDLGHALAGDLRDGAGRGGGFGLGCVVQILVLEVEGLVVVVDLRQVRVGEDVGEHAPLAAELGHDLAIGPAPPATLPAVLVLPVLGIADAGLGLDVVEPSVFDALARGPDVLAGDRAGMAADALVEVQHLADLRADLHSAASLYRLFSASGRSFQSTSRILRIMTNSSRLEPTVP